MLIPLPPAPKLAYDPATFRANVGAYAGQIHEVRWGYYRGWVHGQVRRALVRKRWFQIVIHAGAQTLVVRLEDDGTIGIGRVLLLDRKALHAFALCEHGAPLRTIVVGPDAGEGTKAFLKAGDADLRFTREAGASAWSLVGRWSGVVLDLVLESASAPTPSVVIGEAMPPLEHRPGLTQRAPLLAVSGTANVDGRPLDVHGASAEVTYTNVFLPRFTRTRGISAHGMLDGRPAALAITTPGLLGATHEATLFVDGKPHHLGRLELRADFEVEETDVDLAFTREASFGATEERMGGLVHHTSEWIAGELVGTLSLPDGTKACIAWPALAEEHQFLR